MDSSTGGEILRCERSAPTRGGRRGGDAGDGKRGLTRGKRILLSLFLSPIAALLLFFLLDLLFPFPWKALDRPPAVVIADREGEPLRFLLPEDGRWRLPVKLGELPPELPRALVASEDQRFWHHPGVDPLAILRAAWSDLRARQIISGGSTIPMQIARMAEPRRRNLWSKARESFRALQLTRRYSKTKLLEIYLNLLPYGGNVEGVGAASWFYFGKAPERLSLGEIALLTALPRSPQRYDPTTGQPGQAAARTARGAFPEGEIAAARLQPIPVVRRRPPFVAPHWCELVASGLGSRPNIGGMSGPARLRTSLDRRLQRTAEEQVARRAKELAGEGIANAAVVVIENRTHAVRALVGSADFFDRRHQGQVNGATARRSPGSTLKPFLYGMALDEGRLLPDSYVLDVPTDYSGYVPENYDGQYHGRVTVREALIHSLNAPAVRLLAEVGLADFHKLLLKGGIATLDRPVEKYGLPLILGAGEVTLLDLANLYASLADGGQYQPYRTLEEGPEPPRRRSVPRSRSHRVFHPRPRNLPTGAAPERLLSPEAAWAITGILTDLRRPDLPDAWDIARDVPAVAWKTGTSYGHRDAWAVGWSGRYTIGVWVGNFDARPVQGISGSQHAGPLLFDLFRAIERTIGEGGGAEAPRKPLGVEPEEIEVCAESHELPGPYCPTRIRVPYLPGRSKLSACAYHRQVLVDARSGDLLSGDCVSARPHRFRVLTVYPPELAAWWRTQGNHVDDLPRLAAGCSGVPSGEAPKIVSPDASTAYHLRKDAPAEFQRIPLVARAGPGATHLFWYQDGLLVATNAPGEKLFLPPERGLHRLVVTDDLGRSEGVTYRVE